MSTARCRKNNKRRKAESDTEMAGKQGSYSLSIRAVDQTAAGFRSVNKKLHALTAPMKALNKEMTAFSRLSGMSSIGTGLERIAGSARTAVGFLGQMSPAIAAITGAGSIAGILKLTQSWYQHSVQLNNTAKSLRMNARDLAAWQGTARLAGSSAEAMTSGLMHLGTTMQDAVAGRAPDAMRMFQSLGIDIKGVGLTAKSVTEIMPQLVEKIASIKDPFVQATLAQQAFGGSAHELMPFLRQGPKAIADLRRETEKYNVINAKGVEAADRIRIGFTKLQMAGESMGYAIAEKMAPGLERILGWTNKWILANRDLIATKIGEYAERFGKWLEATDFSGVLEGITGFAKGANDVAQALGGWETVTKGLFALWVGSKFAAVLSNVALLGATIAKALPTGLISLLARFAGPIAVAAGAAYGLHQLAEQRVSTPEEQARQRNNFSRRGALDNTPPTNNAQQADLGAQAMSYFQSMGWSAEQAAGMVANLQAESNFNHKAVGDGGRAYGVAQWHPDRQAEFKRMFGKDIRESNFDEQLDFIHRELTQGKEKSAGDRLRGARTAAEAGDIVSRYYERPAKKEEEAARRADLAQRWHSRGQQQSLPLPPPPPPEPPMKPDTQGNINVSVDFRNMPANVFASATATGNAFSSPVNIRRSTVGGMG